MSKTVLITGASGGIGLELAKKFAQEGFDLVLVARSEDKLTAAKKLMEKEYPVSVKVLARDLTENNAPEEIFHALAMENRFIDILVNNAGMGDFGEFAEADLAKQDYMIQLNVVALMHMTKLFLKPMLERRQGRILNVASIAAFQPGPLMSIYYATKAFVLSFSESLSRELKGSGVTVTALCPGPTWTGFGDVASLEKSKLFSSMKVTTPDKVAAYGYRAVMKGHPVAIHGSLNKLTIFSIRLAPRSLVREVIYRMQGKVEV